MRCAVAEAKLHRDLVGGRVRVGVRVGVRVKVGVRVGVRIRVRVRVRVRVGIGLTLTLLNPTLTCTCRFHSQGRVYTSPPCLGLRLEARWVYRVWSPRKPIHLVRDGLELGMGLGLGLGLVLGLGLR